MQKGKPKSSTLKAFELLADFEFEKDSLTLTCKDVRDPPVLKCSYQNISW